MGDHEGLLERLAVAIESSPHNLMSPRGLEELRSRHLPECVALAGMLPRGPGAVVDIGSGGGLPGLVIAIVRPDLEVTLVEATKKKAAFLRETGADLGLEVEVVAERAEDLHDRLGGRFDLATARAVAPFERLIPWVMPLLAPGGLLYAVKGERWQEELGAVDLDAVGARIAATPDDLEEAATNAPRVVIIAADGLGTTGEDA
ncbi:MAG: 16S rRNA (guanine(527)-N(7))-methyltransferase RsmG [Nitriliruptorales bacterium]|nr:16S rRNA (guanine(527)-N(7))-methyltransferase RsmG [Nitriliruptorales bacterium]